MFKRYTRIGALILTAVLLMALTACGGIKAPDTYHYDDLSKYIKLGKYKGLEYTKTVAKVTQSDIQSSIDDALDNAKTTKDVKSGTVGKKSKVKIDYTGRINGKKFDNGSATDYTLDIANDSMIDGFSEGIVGHKVGDTFKEHLQFPKNYSDSDVAGKKVVFTIKVKAIVKDVVPEYNDAFVKKNTKYDTTEEYEKSIRKKLEKKNEEKAEANARKEVFSKILSSSKVVKYPDAELKDAKDNMKSTYKKLAENYSMSYSDFLKQYMNTTEEDFNKKVDSYAKNTVKQQLVLRALADKLDVTVSDSDYNDYIQDLLSANNMDEDSFKEQSGMTIEEYAEQNNLYDSLLYERVMDKVMKLSKQK